MNFALNKTVNTIFLKIITYLTREVTNIITCRTCNNYKWLTCTHKLKVSVTEKCPLSTYDGHIASVA